MIIDIHVHAFPDELEVKVVEALEARYKVRSLYPCTVNSLVNAMANVHVDLAVIQIYANSPGNVRRLNDWGVSVAERFTPKLLCFGTVHPDMPNPDVELERIAKLGLRGVKFQPTAQRFHPDDRRLFRIYEKIDELHLPILFHAGEERAPVDKVWAHPERFVQVLSSFPNLTIILAHLGGYRMWRYVPPLTAFKNAYFDTSAAVADMDTEELTRLVTMLDVDQVMFGSDFPWFDYQDALNGVTDLDLPEEDREKILWRNAAGILGILAST